MSFSYSQTEESFLFEEMLRLESAPIAAYAARCDSIHDAEFLKNALDQSISSYFEVKKEIENRSPVSE